MDSTPKRRKEDPPPGLFTLHLRHGGRIIKTLPAQYIGGEVSTFNNMEEDEWGLVCLKEKVSEIGLGMDEGFRYFTLTAKGLQELLQDCEVWDLVNQCNSPKVIEIWIVKGIVGADCSNDGSGEEVDGTEEEYDGSGEELDGSGQELDGSGEDDADFVNNTDMNAEYGGLGDLEVQNQDNDYNRATVCEEVNYSDEGSLCGSDGETEGMKLPKFLKEVEGKCPKFSLGLTFKDKGEFKEAITNYAIKEGKEMKYEKNDKVRCVVKCKHSSCPWQITLRHGGRIIKTLPAQYIGGEVSTFNNMEEDEWGLVCLKEKVSEIGLGMDEGFRYFTLTAKGLQELLQDCEVWDLVNQCNSPKVIEIWIVKGIVGADCSNDGSGEEVDGTEEEYDGSGEELDGSGQELDGSGEDDADFVNNTDMNAEYGGLGDLEVQNQDNDYNRATVCEEVNYSDEGSLCGSDGETEGMKLPKFLKEVEGKCPKFSLGLTFKDKGEFKEAITNYAIKEGKEMKYEKNDKVRCVVKCKHSSCPWQITLRYVKDEKCWRISVLKDKHDGCVRTKKNAMVNSTIVAKRWKQEIKGHLDWKTNQFLSKVCTDDHYTISKKQAWRALTKAKSEIYCEAEDYFNKIWCYCKEIKRTNPKTRCEVELSDLKENGKERFKRMYICWEATREGFKHCRKIIGLDGCHLKCKTGGQLLTAVGVDGNESIFPISYAIVENENKDSWKWFLSLLKKDLQLDAISQTEFTMISDKQKISQTEFTMISDKQKSLIQAFESMMPGVKHRFCVRHLHCNMRVAGFTARHLHCNMRVAGFTANHLHCNMRVAGFTANTIKDALWKDKHPSEWSRSHFTGTAHCDILVNNISESFNSMRLAARENPVINCLELIRKRIATRLFEFNTKAVEWTGVICPTIVKKIDEIEKQAGGLIGYQCGSMAFEIVGTVSGQYSVDLATRSCTCRRWDLIGIPCPHAVCAIWIKHEKGPIWHYVDPCYLISTYMKTYAGCINPMAGYEEWPSTDREPPLPPLYNAKPGRPRKLRKKSRGETSKTAKTSKGGERRESGVYLTRKHVRLHCTTCKQPGHNTRKCPQNQVTYFVLLLIT
ncbi:uncharacterized protein LOC116029817 [Ipomoea triloba]|uniref:uncharacterized protein LOC116029817 n=1 Tax=Ipomoea triloba TaxID=35885 RepID=UPI00125E3D31|nr:uncharacterized protein LOC116029817 [Ipomoea triloba]